MTVSNRAGIPSRRKSLMIAAAIVASLMLISPTLVAADTDASFTKDEAAFIVKADNPTNSEFETYNIDKGLEISNASKMFTEIFNLFILGSPVIKTGSFSAVMSNGRTVESKATTGLGTTEIFTKDLRAVYTATSDGDLISPIIETSSVYYQQAAMVVENYLGEKLYEGDKLIITGKVNQRLAFNSTYSYASVDSTHSVREKTVIIQYYVQDMDVNIELSRAGETDSKSIRFVSDIEVMVTTEGDYDYKGVKYSDLTPSSPCTIVYNSSSFSFESGSAKYIIDGRELPVKLLGQYSFTQETTADIWPDDQVDIKEFKEYVNGLPASSGNVTVSKSYHDVESEFGDVMADVVEKEIINILQSFIVPLIAVLIILVVIVTVVVVVLIKKR